jgi:hypothetical protein
MFLSRKNKVNIFLFGFCIILLIIVFKEIDFSVKSGKVFESYNNYNNYNNDVNNFYNDNYNVNTSKVDLPLNSSGKCQNGCGPNARCYIGGTQCFTDTDCIGCALLQKNSSLNIDTPLAIEDNVAGENDAGKLSFNSTPQYSKLTSGYGTKQREIIDDFYDAPPPLQYGVNTWSINFATGDSLFKQRYTPTGTSFTPNYPRRTTLSGEFIDDGPLPSNAPF